MWLIHDIHVKEIPKSAFSFLWYICINYFSSIIIYALKLRCGYGNPEPDDIKMLTDAIFLKGLPQKMFNLKAR